MKLTPKTSEIIRRAMDNAKGDDLERARRAFGSMNATQLDAPHGESGMTRREILDQYKKHRAEHNTAMEELKPFLS